MSQYEPGIFSRLASKTQVSRNGRRDVDYDFGTNPCSEIILRDRIRAAGNAQIPLAILSAEFTKSNNKKKS